MLLLVSRAAGSHPALPRAVGNTQLVAACIGHSGQNQLCPVPCSLLCPSPGEVNPE